MELIVFHYHFRPGGVRRIIELATPELVRRCSRRVSRVTLATGERPDRRWWKNFQRRFGNTSVELFFEPAFGYFSEQTTRLPTLRKQIDGALKSLLSRSPADEIVVWAHNLSLARNLIVTDKLTTTCQRLGVRLAAHHHDWWFDNRWLRWPECRRAGFRTMESVARAIFDSAHTRHVTINHADAVVLARHARHTTTWLPNLAEPAPPPPKKKIRAARGWLSHRLGSDAPVWLLPCRFLRRKNVAEALLLTRWLRPEAWLVTTGGVSSADERFYFEKLGSTGHAHHWRMRLGILAGDESRKPGIEELVAASEAILLSSIQEGFGLPYLEAAAARRPLIARSLPNIAPDLAKFGFRFPQCYDEIQVSANLFDWKAEQERQCRLFTRWTQNMPASVESLVHLPPLPARKRKPALVPFSRLTLTAQLEILAVPAARSWEVCAPLNPFLKTWRKRAAEGLLMVSHWPRSAAQWLSGPSYAARFWAGLNAAVPPGAVVHADKCQADFIRLKLHPEYLYPLLWNRET